MAGYRRRTEPNFVEAALVEARGAQCVVVLGVGGRHSRARDGVL